MEANISKQSGDARWFSEGMGACSGSRASDKGFFLMCVKVVRSSVRIEKLFFFCKINSKNRYLRTRMAWEDLYPDEQLTNMKKVMKEHDK